MKRPVPVASGKLDGVRIGRRSVRAGILLACLLLGWVPGYSNSQTPTDLRRDFLFRTWMSSIGSSATTLRLELDRLHENGMLESHPDEALDRLRLVARIPVLRSSLLSESRKVLASEKPDATFASAQKWNNRALFQLFPIGEGQCEFVLPFLPKGPTGPLYFFAGEVSLLELLKSASPQTPLLEGESLVWWDANNDQHLLNLNPKDQLGLDDPGARQRRASLQELMRSIRENKEGEAMIWALHPSTSEPNPVQIAWRTVTLGEQRLLFICQQVVPVFQGGMPPGVFTGRWESGEEAGTGFSILQDDQWCVLSGLGRLAGLRCEGRILERQLGSVAIPGNLEGVFNLSGRFEDDLTLHLTLYQESRNEVTTQTFHLRKRPGGSQIRSTEPAIPLKIRGPKR